MPSKLYQYAQLLNVTPLAASGNSSAPTVPALGVNAMWGIKLHIKLTIGSLTNAQVVAQVLNPDGSTWEDDYVAGALNATSLSTVSNNFALTLFVYGCKSFRVRYTSTGTVTSSALIVDATAYPIL